MAKLLHMYKGKFLLAALGYLIFLISLASIFYGYTWMCSDNF